MHSAPLPELASGQQATSLNLAEILAGWKADNPDIDIETLLLAGAPRDTVDSVSATCNCSSSAPHTAAGNGPAGSARSRAQY